MIEVDVLIAGAGPVGLTLAHELIQRGVDVMLVERNLHSTRHPKMDITNARSMEHYRRLGLAAKIRARATPPTHPVSVVWTDKHGGKPIARFDYPSYEQACIKQGQINDGTGTAEPLMRVSQFIVEPVLRELLESSGNNVRVEFGVRFESFSEDATGILSKLTNTQTGEDLHVRSKYLVGCDGASSQVRRALGIGWDVMDSRRGPIATIRRRYGLLAAAGTLLRTLAPGRKVPDGRVYLIHFKSKDLTFWHRNGVFWREQCAQTGDTLIAQDDVDTWTLHVTSIRRWTLRRWIPSRCCGSAWGVTSIARFWRPSATVALPTSTSVP